MKKYTLKSTVILALSVVTLAPTRRAAHALEVMPVPPAAPVAGGSVQLPYALRDAAGNQWNIDQDGSISDGSGDLYDGGGHLMFNGGEQGYASPTNQARLEESGGELVLPPIAINGLNVSRRIGIDAKGKGGWCRFVEVLENPTNAPVRARLLLNFNMAGGIQGSQPIIDQQHADKPQIGAAVFDGDDAIAMIAAGRGSNVQPIVSARPDESVVDITYDVEVPARQTVALVHLQVRRMNFEEAAQFFASTKDRDLLAGLPKDVLKRVINFAPRGESVGDLEILRGDLLDVVELRGGDRYKGTLKEPLYRLRTACGPVELKQDQVIAMVAVGQYRPQHLFVTTDGQIHAGAIEHPQSHAIRLQLSSGQVTQVPLASIARLGYRKRDGEPEEWTFADPLVMLATGDRLKVRMPSAAIPVQTRYGTLSLPPTAIASIDFRASGHAFHDVLLTDGSRFAGLVTIERFEFKPLTVGGGRTSAVPRGTLAKLVLSHKPQADDPTSPRLSLDNGDLLAATLTEKLTLETTFDALEIDGAEVAGLRHVEPPPGVAGGAWAAPSEVQVTLWDGATLSGRLRGDAVTCRLNGGGVVLAVPVELVEDYVNPQPRPPASAVERVRQTVVDLAAADATARDKAAARLTEMGAGIPQVLRDLRASQQPEAQKRIDEIVKSMEPGGAAKPVAQHPGQQPVAPAEGEIVEEPVGVDIDVEPAEEMPAEEAGEVEIDVE